MGLTSLKTDILAKQNPVLCPAPFSSISVRMDDRLASDKVDSVYSCCCNLKPQSSHHDLNTLKQNIINGVKSDACERCYTHEKNSGYSERMRLLGALDPDNFEQFTNTYTVNHKEVYIKLSNRCPLACRSCQESDSSTFAKIHNKQHLIPLAVSTDITEQDEYQNIKQLLEQVYHEAEYPVVHLTGGEVLVHNGAVEILKWLSDQGLSNKFTVRFTTALSVPVPRRLVDTFNRFRHIHFNISIDSVGTNYQYVRWPAKFSKIENNLEQLEQVKTLCNGFSSSIVPVWTINNIMYLEEFLDYFEHTESWIAPIQVIWPEYLTPEILPQPYRMQVQQKVEQCLPHKIFNDAKHTIFLDFLTTLNEKLCSQQGQNSELFERYLKHSAEYDSKTNLHMSEYNSSFYNILVEEDKNTLAKHYESLVC